MTGNPSRENLLNSVQDFRDFYARFVVRSAGSDSERLIAAFATVEREHYLGAGPWPVFAGSSYIDTISADPRLLYQDGARATIGGFRLHRPRDEGAHSPRMFRATVEWEPELSLLVKLA
jgi:hypothetical protein